MAEEDNKFPSQDEINNFSENLSEDFLEEVEALTGFLGQEAVPLNELVSKLTQIANAPEAEREAIQNAYVQELQGKAQSVAAEMMSQPKVAAPAKDEKKQTASEKFMAKKKQQQRGRKTKRAVGATTPLDSQVNPIGQASERVAQQQPSNERADFSPPPPSGLSNTKFTPPSPPPPIESKPTVESESKNQPRSFLSEMQERFAKKEQQTSALANQPQPPPPPSQRQEQGRQEGITAEALQQGLKGLRSTQELEPQQEQQPKSQNPLMDAIKQAAAKRQERVDNGESKMTKAEQAPEQPQPKTPTRPGISLADIQKGLSSLKKTEAQEKQEPEADVGMFNDSNALSLLNRTKALNSARNATKVGNEADYDSDDDNDWNDDEDEKEKPQEKRVNSDLKEQAIEKAQQIGAELQAKQAKRASQPQAGVQEQRRPSLKQGGPSGGIGA